MNDDLQTILDQAKAAYEEELDRQLAQIATEQREQSERLFKEREEVKAWLCTIMPNAIVEYINLSEYSHQAAGRYSSKDDRQGTWLTISLPDAFPVHLNVYQNHHGFQLVNEPYTQRDEILRFAVPKFAQVECDEEGQPYISYTDRTRRNHANWQTAVGQALALWQERGQRLMAQMREWEDMPKPTENPIPPEPKAREDRALDALESIAANLEQLVTFKGYGA